MTNTLVHTKVNIKPVAQAVMEKFNITSMRRDGPTSDLQELPPVRLSGELEAFLKQTIEENTRN
jgi:hypothetical protein